MSVDPNPLNSVERVIVGGGEMGDRMRAVDWAATPLGPVEGWPQSLRSAVSILLPSKAQIILFWGPDLVALYNDAYRPVFGAKHPWALGLPARECWREVWNVLQPLFEGVMRTGEAFWAQDHLFYLERHGFPEETYFDVSYDPVRDETGGVGGVFCIVSETTGRVVGERRLRALRELGIEGVAKSEAEVCARAASVLGQHPADVPFALFFVLDETGGTARLMDSVGIPRESLAAGESVDLSSGAPAAAVMREVVESGKSAECAPDGFVTSVPRTASAERVLALPLWSGTQPAGVLVCGISRHLFLDDQYRDFLDLVAGRVSTAISAVRAYAEERRRAEALAELDRAKTAFFSNVSHEFRTPLTLLLGPLEDLLRGPARALVPDDRDRVDVAYRNALRLVKLVNSLLDFARLEAGRIEAVYEATDLGAATAELASAFRSLVERAGLSFVVDCPPGPADTFVDREMWEKIVFNLLSNAFKYTLHGEIRVEVREAGDRVETVVSDTGTGIAAGDLPHIFDRFHRVANAQARTHEGTGIGLALVAELVKRHGGTIEVRSEPDVGSTFVVSLPRGCDHLPADRIGAQRTLASTGLGSAPYVEEARRWVIDDVVAPSEAELPRPAGADAPRARVLLADDNADMRDYLGRLLGRYWTVEAVADGVSALAAARARPPDLVLTDVMMPGLTGFELLRALRAEPSTATVTVVMLSARAGEESRVEGLGAGADDYLVKPFSARELVARVQAHLELTATRRRFAAEQEIERAKLEALLVEREAILDRERTARAEADLASQSKDRFLAMLSHELRTPLSSIIGWTRILKNRRIGEAEREHAVQVIERNAQRQAQLINDLLDVSRIAAGKIELERVPLDLVTMVREAVDSLRADVDAKGLWLATDLDPSTGEVFADPLRLQQVVLNLMTNAVKFTPQAGRIDVRLSRRGEMACLVVSDSGDGIDPEVLPTIFEPFSQGEPGPGGRGMRGLGLGLTIVRQLLELHGGTVRAESAGKGLGATFTVELPIVAVRVAPGAKEPGEPANRGPRPSPLAGLSILVVDDQPDARELLTFVMRQRGADTRMAASVDEALDILAATPVDVLVSDLGLPGLDGYALIGAVRAIERQQRGRALLALALTAYAGEEVRDRAIAAGFDAHATKPLDPEDLVALVARLSRA